MSSGGRHENMRMRISTGQRSIGPRLFTCKQERSNWDGGLSRRRERGGGGDINDEEAILAIELGVLLRGEIRGDLNRSEATFYIFLPLFNINRAK